MAGSYKHIVYTDGTLKSNEDFIESIENLGDAYEMAEECFKIINHFSKGQNDLIEKALISIYGESKYK